MLWFIQNVSVTIVDMQILLFIETFGLCFFQVTVTGSPNLDFESSSNHFILQLHVLDNSGGCSNSRHSLLQYRTWMSIQFSWIKAWNFFIHSLVCSLILKGHYGGMVVIIKYLCFRLISLHSGEVSAKLNLSTSCV